MKLSLICFAALASTALLSACTNSSMPAQMAVYSQDRLPEAVKVPSGHKVSMETVGVGRITYECREKAGMPGTFEWVLVGPDAVLNTRAGRMVGKYYGPPATWESSDGSRVTGTQLAVAPAAPGSIPLQLVKANPAMGSGVMTGTAYIQRVATQGGVAPNLACGADNKGKREIVNYQADYIFWTAG